MDGGLCSDAERISLALMMLELITETTKSLRRYGGRKIQL
jgi:hypothetical protein